MALVELEQITGIVRCIHLTFLKRQRVILISELMLTKGSIPLHFMQSYASYDRLHLNWKKASKIFTLLHLCKSVKIDLEVDKERFIMINIVPEQGFLKGVPPHRYHPNIHTKKTGCEDENPTTGFFGISIYVLQDHL
ncbi:hypothetical protein CT694_34255 (plasmid) [Bacillus wiedmannii bv. thuringiensis]|nr:hypothetical protein CT694_34255 [Bacillus wiedmannii bv. thuringiensis]